MVYGMGHRLTLLDKVEDLGLVGRLLVEPSSSLPPCLHGKHMEEHCNTHFSHCPIAFRQTPLRVTSSSLDMTINGCRFSSSHSSHKARISLETLSSPST